MVLSPSATYTTDFNAGTFAVCTQQTALDSGIAAPLDTLLCTANVTFDAAALSGTNTLSLTAGATANASAVTFNMTTPVVLQFGVVLSVSAAPTTAKMGDIVTVTTTLQNYGPVAVSAITVTKPSDITWPVGSACLAAVDLAAPTGANVLAPTGGQQICTANYTITRADMETASDTKTWSFSAASTTTGTFGVNIKQPTTLSVALNRVASIQPSISGCAISTGEFGWIALCLRQENVCFDLILYNIRHAFQRLHHTPPPLAPQNISMPALQLAPQHKLPWSAP